MGTALGDFIQRDHLILTTWWGSAIIGNRLVRGEKLGIFQAGKPAWKIHYLCDSEKIILPLSLLIHLWNGDNTSTSSARLLGVGLNEIRHRKCWATWLLQSTPGMLAGIIITIAIPIVQMWKLRLGKVRWFFTRLHNLDWYLGSLIPEVTLLSVLGGRD